MKNERIFFKCDICGNTVGMIEDAGVDMSCCGQKMTRIEPNTVDAAVEKHVPVALREGDKLVVTIGEVIHPMTPEHYIAWIAVAQGNMTQRMALHPGDEPKAVFHVDKEPATVYAYCNLHGLWAAEL